MFPAGDKAKRLSTVNHTIKTIHHHSSSKTISRTRINRSADIGSAFLLHISSLKYLVVLPPLIKGSWFLSKILTHLTNLLPNQYLSNLEIRNE